MTTRSGLGNGRPDPRLNAIMSERRQLINLSHPLLGSMAEAEDAVQEAHAPLVRHVRRRRGWETPVEPRNFNRFRAGLTSTVSAMANQWAACPQRARRSADGPGRRQDSHPRFRGLNLAGES
jgi:hypothetical protein